MSVAEELTHAERMCEPSQQLHDDDSDPRLLAALLDAGTLRRVVVACLAGLGHPLAVGVVEPAKQPALLACGLLGQRGAIELCAAVLHHVAPLQAGHTVPAIADALSQPVSPITREFLGELLRKARGLIAVHAEESESVAPMALLALDAAFAPDEAFTGLDDPIPEWCSLAARCVTHWAVEPEVLRQLVFERLCSQILLDAVED